MTSHRDDVVLRYHHDVTSLKPHPLKNPAYATAPIDSDHEPYSYSNDCATDLWIVQAKPTMHCMLSLTCTITHVSIKFTLYAFDRS